MHRLLAGATLAFALTIVLTAAHETRAPSPADGFAIHVTAPHMVQGHEMGPVHHYCKPISSEPIIQCLLYDSAEPNANFHDHTAEIATGRVKVLDMPAEEAKKVADLVSTTDGIIFHLWPIGDRIPTGTVEIAQSVGHRPLTAEEFARPVRKAAER